MDIVRYVRLALLATGLSALGAPYAVAQVGGMRMMVIGEICLLNNWNSPRVQKLLQGSAPNERKGFYVENSRPPRVKRCLVQHHPYPQALCEKVLMGDPAFRQSGEPAPDKLSDAEIGLFLNHPERPELPAFKKFNECVSAAGSEAMDESWSPENEKSRGEVLSTKSNPGGLR